MQDPDFPQEFTIKYAQQVVEIYCNDIQNYLMTGKNTVKPKQYMQTYSCVVKLSDENQECGDLFKLYKDKVKSYLDKINQSLVAKSSDTREFLKEYTELWNKYTIYVQSLNKIFSYLDRFYLKNAGDQNLNQTSLYMFKKAVFETRGTELKNALLEEIRKDRENEMTDIDLIRDGVQQYIYMGLESKLAIKKFDGQTNFTWIGEKNLQLYDMKFEKILLENTKEFYLKKSKLWFQQLSCYEYILKISQHLDKEEKNADYFLQEQTKQKITKIFLNETIESWAEQLTNLDLGCKYMFENRKVDQLAIMYKLFVRVDHTLKYIITQMDPFLMAEGKKITKNEELISDKDKTGKDIPKDQLEMHRMKNALVFTEKLLALRAETEFFLQNAFNNDMRFQKARDLAFQNFMNEFERTPLFMAFYIDNEFRKGFKQLSIIEIDKKIESVIRLFCCLNSRDMFMVSYTNMLALRLLNKNSVNNEAEERMIQQLQVECGHNTVSKIKTMIKDMSQSQQVMRDFNQLNHGGIQGVEYTAEILTSGHWPYQESPNIAIPKSLSHMQGKFDTYYKSKFNNRKVIWLYHLGQLTAQTSYLPKKYQIVISVFQYAILDLFEKNKTDVLTVGNIKEATNLSQEAMAVCLRKFCDPKVRFLLKERAKMPVFNEPTEKITLNRQFQSDNIRVIMNPQMTLASLGGDGTGGRSVNAVEEEVMKLRGFQIDATIVRIMKSRKVEMHNELMAQVIKQITMFHAQPTMIVQRIQHLIEKEYIEESTEVKGRYTYIP